jgi:hypothetical protein
LPNFLSLQVGRQRVNPLIESREGKFPVFSDDRFLLRMPLGRLLQDFRGKEAY